MIRVILFCLIPLVLSAPIEPNSDESIEVEILNKDDRTYSLSEVERNGTSVDGCIFELDTPQVICYTVSNGKVSYVTLNSSDFSNDTDSESDEKSNNVKYKVVDVISDGKDDISVYRVRRYTLEGDGLQPISWITSDHVPEITISEKTDSDSEGTTYSTEQVPVISVKDVDHLDINFGL